MQATADVLNVVRHVTAETLRSDLNMWSDVLGKYLQNENFVPLSIIYGLDNQVSIPGKGRDFFLRHRVQTGPGAHPASYPMGVGGSFPD
jgi:hypothetical protein